MKPDTHSFYSSAVSRALARVTSHLDDALDLTALAREAALSPFHFHRIFRGMLGETPLELHRRLRMERAAWSILQGERGITRIALDAGYETHEAFTRAFHQLYGVAPSLFRRAAEGTPRTRSFELAARSGVHFCATEPGERAIHFLQGDRAMHIEIEQMPAIRLATVRHVGPYPSISEAFAKLGAIAGEAGLHENPGAAMIAVYYDDPESTPADALRSDAALSVPPGIALPKGTREVHLRAGRYATATHAGSYDTLGDTWSRLMGEWLPKSGERVGEGESYELYRNNPGNAKEADLRTDIFVPLARL